MKISNNWLKDYIKTDLKTEKIGEYLTDIGLEVEGIEKYESVKGSLEGIVVGKDVVIGAGTVVITNIPDGAKVVGNPGRII